MSVDLNRLVDHVVFLASTASNKIREAVDRHDPATLNVRRKSSFADLVTDLDVEIEEEIVAGLEDLLPGSLVIGEELLRDGSRDLFWTVDPIDGTTNVVHGVPHAATAVALWQGGSPTMAVVCDPFAGTAYTAVRGAGAFRRTFAEGADRVALAVSRVSSLSDALIAFGLPYDRSLGPHIFEVAGEVFARCQDMRRGGSASLDLVSVASGSFDAYLELELRPWDIGAGGLVLEEAGGRLTAWHGGSVYDPDREARSNVLATNGALHEQLLALTEPRRWRVA